MILARPPFPLLRHRLIKSADLVKAWSTLVNVQRFLGVSYILLNIRQLQTLGQGGQGGQGGLTPNVYVPAHVVFFLFLIFFVLKKSIDHIDQTSVYGLSCLDHSL